MQLRILGAHQSSSVRTKPTSLLVDGQLAIDAGCVAGALTLEEQENVRDILLTHQHYDHIRDIPAIGLNTMRSGTTNAFCIEETRDAILTHLLNDVLWPDLTRMPSADHPTIAFFTVEALKPFYVNDYQVLAVPVHHAVPTVGYQVEKNDRRLFYTSDMGGDGKQVWPHVDPHVLISEVTFPNHLEEVASEAKHLTPALLGRELQSFRSLKGYLPKVIVIHMNAYYCGEIRSEVDELARTIGADITIAEENMIFEI